MHEKLFHGLVVEQEDFDLLNARELLGSFDLRLKLCECCLGEVIKQVDHIPVDDLHFD